MINKKMSASSYAYLLVMKPAKVQLIHPPIRIIGRTFVRVPFSISNAILGSGGGDRRKKIIYII